MYFLARRRSRGPDPGSRDQDELFTGGRFGNRSAGAVFFASPKGKGGNRKGKERRKS
jgi:hypothetical protein